MTDELSVEPTTEEVPVPAEPEDEDAGTPDEHVEFDLRVEPIRQWVSLARGSCNLRVGHDAIELLGPVVKGASSTRRFCVLAVQEGTDEDVAERVRRQLTDVGCDVERIALPAEGACRTLDEARALFDVLAARAVTGDDLLCAIGRVDALSLVAHVASSWCDGMELCGVPLDLSSSLIASITPRGIDVAGKRELIAVKGHAKSFFVDLALMDLDPEAEDARLARAIMAQSALIDSEKAFSTLWDRANDLRAGDASALAEQMVDTLKSRGRVVASSAISLRQSIDCGVSFVRAMRTLAPGVAESCLVGESLRFVSRLSAGKEQLAIDDVLAIDELLERLGIGSAICDVDPNEMFAALKAEHFLRSRRFMLGLPRALGRVRLATVEDELLREHTQAWCAVHRS
jgi:3-dehydroquinate synthetase